MTVRAGASLFDDVTYCLTVDVPLYEPRRIKITLTNGAAPRLVSVTADGPTDSEHRFRDDSLCIQFRDDSPVRNWVAKDGLRGLIALVAVHLYKEAYCREFRVPWQWDQAPHDERPAPLPRRARRASRRTTTAVK